MKSKITPFEEVKVTFRFVGDNVNPEMITSRVGLQPSAAHEKGEIVKKHPEQVYPTGFWSLDSSIPSDRPLGEHVEQLLSILESKTLILKGLRDIGLVPTFYCGCFITGTTTSVKIKADILQRMADIGASLEYYLYCCNEED
ncbi:MAG: DUF4279 domain-containing protein [Anaerolineae bacterium]|nr:DUF4279 domain-containing protein [Anaerolineae bacterium]